MTVNPTDQPETFHSRRATLLLMAGALLGIVLAASGLAKPGGAGTDSDAIAKVAGTVIKKSDYLAYLDAIARERRNPLTAEDQRHVLNRMIDEQLLLARGLEMGLPMSSYPVRKAIVQELTQSVLAAAASEAIEEPVLQQFYTNNAAFFAHPARTRLQRLVFKERDGRSARENAEQAYLAIKAGNDLDAVGARYAVIDPVPLPTEALPDNKLLQYLGPSLTTTIASLPAGASTEPVGIGNAYQLVYVVNKYPMHSPALAEVRDRVTAEYERRRAEQAIRDYLQELRRQEEVSIDEDFLNRIALEADGDH